MSRFPRRVLFQIARAADVRVRSDTRKHALIDALARLSWHAFEDALAGALTRRDLQDLCSRVGFARGGTKADLAARLVAAIEERDVRLSRWRTFAEARAFARGLGLRGQSQWFAFGRGLLPDRGALPDDVPRAPHYVYADDGWTSWGDFLGTDNPARQLVTYRPFRKARAYARSLGLRNANEWRAHCSARRGNRRVAPPDIPAAPNAVYAEWVSWSDWLGTTNVHASQIRYRSYREARRFVQALGIRTEPEWRAYCRGELRPDRPRPIDIPTNPHRTYRDKGWKSWGAFFGTGTVAAYKRSFRPFRDARAFARRKRFASNQAWRAWCAAGKRPADIPVAPDQVYRDRGWRGWGDFLGTGNKQGGRRQRRR